MSSSCPVSGKHSVALTPYCLSISPLHGIYHYVRADHTGTLTSSCVVIHLNVLHPFRTPLLINSKVCVFVAATVCVFVTLKITSLMQSQKPALLSSFSVILYYVQQNYRKLCNANEGLSQCFSFSASVSSRGSRQKKNNLLEHLAHVLITAEDALR